MATVSMIFGNPNNRSRCEVCPRQMKDKDECIDMGCTIPTEHHDGDFQEDMNKRIALYKIRVRDLSGPFNVASNNYGNRKGACE